MCGELRALHDRLHATTVYVTHDQLEAMAMADTIAVMNHGRDRATRSAPGHLRPAGDVFVAGFIGSPAMNFLPFRGRVPAWQRSAGTSRRRVAMPERARGHRRRPTWRSACAPST